jgi:hypothetical protein
MLIYKIWRQIISFDMKKRGNSKTSHKKSKSKNVNLIVLKVSPYVFKSSTPIMLGLRG